MLFGFLNAACTYIRACGREKGALSGHLIITRCGPCHLDCLGHTTPPLGVNNSPLTTLLSRLTDFLPKLGSRPFSIRLPAVCRQTLREVYTKTRASSIQSTAFSRRKSTANKNHFSLAFSTPCSRDNQVICWIQVTNPSYLIRQTGCALFKAYHLDPILE